MDIFDILGHITDFLPSWKWLVSLSVGIGVSAFLAYNFPDQTWVWFVNVPLILASIVVAYQWSRDD